MKNDLMVDMLGLTLSQKSISRKIFYFLKGVIFFLFLVFEERKQKKGEGNTSDTGQTGDDVYPLF